MVGMSILKRFIGFAFIATALCFGVPRAEAAARFAICSVTCTWDGASTAMWSTTSGGGTGASVPGSGDAVTLDVNTCVGGVTCTITVNTNFSIQSLTTGACTASTTGCVLDFSVNNNNVTIGGANNGWNNSGTGTRAIKLGSGTFTMSDASGNIWNWTTITNFTLTAGTSTILYSAVATGGRTFIGGAAQTYNNFTVTNASSNGGAINVLSTGNTFANLTLTNVRQFTLPSNTTTTVTGTLIYNGSASEYGTLTTGSGATGALDATLSVANAWAPTNLLIQNTLKAGAGSIACNPCVDGGGNTTSGTFTITPPAAGGGRIIGG